MAWDNSLAEAVKLHNLENPLTDIFDIVSGSRATTVAKSSTSRRFINIEPTFNMFLQQGLMSLMYKLMKKWGLDVKTLPDTHKELARRGSLDLQSATIDWSQASNLISNTLVTRQLPGDWGRVLQQLRSNTVEIDGELHTVSMFAAMGNATTFPVETLIFWAYAQAVHFYHLFPNTNSSIFSLDSFPFEACSVFGDDCIVPTVIADQYIRTMTLLGCSINDAKSFYGNLPFRESCGGDFLRGVDVRPYTLARPDTERKSALEPFLNIIFNRLIDRYKHALGDLNYIYDKHAFRVLLNQYEKHNLKLRVVPDYFPDDSGVKISSDIQRLVTAYGVKSHALAPLSRSHHGTFSFSYCRYLYRTSKVMCDEIRYNMWLKNPVIREFSDTRISVTPLTRAQLKHERTQCSHNHEHFALTVNIVVPSSEYKERKDGSYIVAKGISSHWEVPVIDYHRAA